MKRILSALLAAVLFTATLAPTGVAEARDRDRGYHGRHYDRDYDRRYYGRRHRDDDGDAVAAGAVGLILGLALGSLASQPRQSDRYYAPPPPPPRYYDQGYGGSAYERDYGYRGYDEPPFRTRCMRAERRWDRYAGRYVIVDVPC